VGTYDIRSATLADAESVAGLINAAFVVERVAFEGDRIDVPGVRELMAKGTFLLAENGAEPLGCAYVEKREERSYLGLLAVAPGRQGTGLGRRLVATAEQYARQAGCAAMDLRIISPREKVLVPFYARLGYTGHGTASLDSAIPAKVPCHYVLMSKPLPNDSQAR
jgi:GNAT superfamily N-acetyltransferase